MKIVEIVKQHSPSEDPFGKGYYTVRYEDGTVKDVWNPLTAGMEEADWKKYCAERLQRIIDSGKGAKVTAGIKAVYGIRDEHHPEPYN